MFVRYGSTDSEKAIIAYPRNIRVPYHVYMTGKHISPNKEGRRALVEGHFVSKKDGVHRFLPRSRVTTTPSGNRFKVKNPYVFVPGDTLYIIQPVAVLSVSGVGEAGITINKNRTFKYTPVGAANTTEAASMIASYFNSQPDIAELLELISSGANISFYSPISQPLVTFTPSGTLGTTETTTAVNTTPIGTIQAIDIETEEFIFASNVTATLPINAVVGVPQDEVLGIFTHSVDYTAGGITSQHFGVIDEAKVYKLALPHYDNSLVYECPRLHVREVWS